MKRLDSLAVALVCLAGLAFGQPAFGAVTFNRTDYAVGLRPRDVAVGDMNRDGRPDLVTANSDEASLSTLLGTGDGRSRRRRTASPAPASHRSRSS